MVGAGNLDSDSDRTLETGSEADLVLGKAYTVHTDCQEEGGSLDHSQDLMDADNLVGHWVWVLHILGVHQGVVGRSHMAEGRVVLLDTDQEEGSPPVNLAGTGLGDMADGTPEHH